MCKGKVITAQLDLIVYNIYMVMRRKAQNMSFKEKKKANERKLSSTDELKEVGYVSEPKILSTIAGSMMNQF